MLFSIIQAAREDGNISYAIIQILLSLPIIFISLSFHEAAHGFIAYKMGDRTAYNLGRVTLNPVKHLDPIGSLCMLVFGFGWAKPVPINTRNFRKPKLGMALTGLAGPLSNFLLGIVATAISATADFAATLLIPRMGEGTFGANLLEIIGIFFWLFAFYNFPLMAFNLIPVPPFDGSRFMLAFLPANAYFKIMRYERIIMLVILVLMWVLPFSPFSWIASMLYNAIYIPIRLLLALIFGLIL